MLIRIFASQIPSHWEAIKYAAVKVDEVDAEYRPAYLNQLLHDLLCSKAHCFIRTDAEKTKIKAVIIVSVEINKIRMSKHLLLKLYYAFEKSSKFEWSENMVVAKEFALQEGCVGIAFTSRNPKIIELGVASGFVEVHKRYYIGIGGK